MSTFFFFLSSCLCLHILCFLNICIVSACLEVHFLPQNLQGSEIPSRWFASMWSRMLVGAPSFPHRLQMEPLCLPLPSLFSLRLVIDFTFLLSSSNSSLTNTAWPSSTFVSLVLAEQSFEGPFFNFGSKLLWSAIESVSFSVGKKSLSSFESASSIIPWTFKSSARESKSACKIFASPR